MFVRARSTAAAVALAVAGVAAPVAVSPAVAAPTAAPAAVHATTFTAGSTSTTARKRYVVKVDKTKLRAKPGKHATFHIRVDRPGSTVKLQTKTRRGWVTITSRTLPKNSGTGALAAEVWGARRGTYLFRARVIDAKRDGTSPVITLTVR